MDLDFSTKAGIQKFIVTLVGLIVEALATFGVAQGTLDTAQSIITLATPILVMVIYFIVNQMAAKGKAAAAQNVLETKAATLITLAETAPQVAIAMYKVADEPIAPTVSLVKDRIKAARATYGTWEGAKGLLLGTFKDRFEAALKRFASIGGTTIEVARKAVYEVTGAMLDDKACETIGQTPGFLGAIGANVDIKIIADLITAIDKTPELAYLKTSLTKRAQYYAVKAIVDDAMIRIQAGEGNAASRLALQEFGYTPEQARNAQYSGGVVDGFDPWARAGIDPFTGEDL